MEVMCNAWRFLSVFLLVNLHKIYWTDLFLQTYLWTEKNCLNFGCHLPLGPDPGLFSGILGHCKTGHYSQFG